MRLSQLVLATNNGGKVAEFKQILGGEIDICTLEDLRLVMPEVNEVCQTFAGNAMLKAYATLAIFGNQLVRRCDESFALIAEDSGIIVPALSGYNGGLKEFPGVRSKRWHHGSDEDRNQQLLSMIQPKNLDNKAYMMCAIALVGPGVSEVFLGEVRGTLVAPRGSGGFGYDPIFQPSGLLYTFGEMDPKTKNTFSHRRRAIESLLHWLEAERGRT